MEKMKQQTTDITSDNISAILALFPDCLTEVKDENGNVKRAINFDTLRQHLQDVIVEGQEHYEFTWPGKRASVLEAAQSIRKTLRPCPDESVNWDTTQNLYIEGDNLDVLKLLRNGYMGKVKMIYIDPPYNTGSDSFVYPDDYSQDAESYEKSAGYRDDEGRKFKTNSDSNGRYHSNWCSMMYSRLMLARTLLSDDGVIFISIDDNEVTNLCKLCNDVFGESNRIALMTIQSNPRGSQNSNFVSSVHEYILMYAKSVDSISVYGIEKSDDIVSEYKESDSNGLYRLIGLRKRGGAWRKEDRPNMFYPIYVSTKTGEVSLEQSEDFPIEVIPKRPTGELGRWCWGKAKFLAERNMLVGKRVNRSNEPEAYDIFRKDYLCDESGKAKTSKVKTIWTDKETNYQNAKNEIRALFGNSEMFDYPKPTYIIEKLYSMIDDGEDNLILDFFSGSASAAQAIMHYNSIHSSHNRFIMVQYPEKCDEKSEAYKAGYSTIAEIGKERIRRAGKKIKEDAGLAATSDLDTGFRVLKCDSSNMKDVYYAAGEYSQGLLTNAESNIKEDRTDIDLLFGCLIDWGLTLSMPYTSEKIGDCTVHTYNDGDLIACFDDNIPDDVIKEIAKRQPLRAVFRDRSFRNSPSKINVGEIFKLIAPNTSVKVI